MWRVALDNLQRATNQPLWQEASGVLRGRWGDGLAAARLVLPELLTPRGFSGPAVAFTTTEDTFLIAPANDDAALLAAFEAATTDVERVLAEPSGVDPFTAQPWLLVNGTWEPWIVAEGHPLAPMIRTLQARIDASR